MKIELLKYKKVGWLNPRYIPIYQANYHGFIGIGQTHFEAIKQVLNFLSRYQRT